jgi:hypothetical protein
MWNQSLIRAKAQKTEKNQIIFVYTKRFAKAS